MKILVTGAAGFIGYHLCEKLIALGNIKDHQVFKITDYKEAAEKADIVVFLVRHKEFLGLEMEEGKVVLDFCGV